ncbi:hypothetical protein POP12_159 [Pectobacterium phage POP12]|nr:hypothetical protein POP12_159 [Pectobacterium phage POP12]
MNDSCFTAMCKMVDEKFHYLTGKQRKYIKNHTSNIIRHCKHDVYRVWVSNQPMKYAQYSYDTDFVLNNGTRIYVHIQID